MPETKPDPVLTHVIRVAELPEDRPTLIEIVKSPQEATTIAALLGIPAARKVSLRGQMAPLNSKDWLFTGIIGATVVQPCVATLDPVTTRLDSPVKRSWVAGYILSDDPGETEMDPDETIEPLTPEIDLGALLVESLALALPDYPRLDGLGPTDAQFTAPGVVPLSDEDVKPFAGLSALRDKLASKSGDTDNDAD